MKHYKIVAKLQRNNSQLGETRLCPWDGRLLQTYAVDLTESNICNVELHGSVSC